MLAILGTIISSVLGGGATGLLGVLIQRFFDMKNKAQDIEVIVLNHKNALELRTLELRGVADKLESDRQIAMVEADGREAVAEQDRLGREAEAEARSSVASYAADKAAYYTGQLVGDKWYVAAVNALVGLLLGLVDVVRGFTRPALTLYTIGLTTYMFIWIQNIVAKMGLEQFTPTEIKNLTMQIVGAVLYLTTVSFVWWFGTRPPKQGNDK